MPKYTAKLKTSKDFNLKIDKIRYAQIIMTFFIIKKSTSIEKYN